VLGLESVKYSEQEVVFPSFSMRKKEFL